MTRLFGRSKRPACAVARVAFSCLVKTKAARYQRDHEKASGFTCPLLSFSALALAQDAPTNAAPLKIAAIDAKEHIGANVIVAAKVAEVNKIPSLMRLNLDQPYPNQPLTAIIFSEKTNLFPELENLKGKMIEITGKITQYRSRPQIVLASTNQLRVVETEAPTEKK
jgi:DNA/RNA endonuclease YhcR with UshA esterase domain